MNGTSKGTSGVVDLGTVITDHQDISGKANTADLATVATSGNYNDLSNKPTIPAAQVQSDWNATSGMGVILNKPTIPDVSTLATKTELNGKQDKINDLVDIRANSGKGVADMSSNEDGSVVTTLANGDTYTIDLNHEHPQYLEIDDIDDYISAGSNVTITKNQQTGVLTISTSGGSGSQVQANWSESDSTSAAYIQNKPLIPTVPTNVSSFTNDANYLKFQLCADEVAYNAIPTKDSGTLYLIPES